MRSAGVYIEHASPLTSIIVLSSRTFINASPFGSSIPSSSILAIRHVREQKILSGLFALKTVLRQAYPRRPDGISAIASLIGACAEVNHL